MSNPLLLQVDPAVGADNRGWVQLAVVTNGVAENGGKKFEITPEDIAAYAADIRANPDRIPIDYDHSYAEGGGTRAAGWVDASSAEVRANGQELWAQVDWTPAAAEAIKAGEYRYFSPEIAFKERDKKTGVLRKAAEFLAGALTNRPFFKNMAPVRLSEAHPIDPIEGDPMSKALTTALGLAEDADEKTIAAAIKERDDKVTAAEKAATEAAEKLTAAQAELDALKTTATDSDKKVTALELQVATLAQGVHESKRQALLDAAIAGPKPKMLPAERDAMVALYDKAGHEAIVALLDARPEIPLNTGKGSAGGSPAGDVALTAKVDGQDIPIDPETAELAAKVDAYLLTQKLDHAPTQDDFLRAVQAVNAAA